MGWDGMGRDRVIGAEGWAVGFRLGAFGWGLSAGGQEWKCFDVFDGGAMMGLMMGLMTGRDRPTKIC